MDVSIATLNPEHVRASFDQVVPMDQVVKHTPVFSQRFGRMADQIADDTCRRRAALLAENQDAAAVIFTPLVDPHNTISSGVGLFPFRMKSSRIAPDTISSIRKASKSTICQKKES
jgi:hypothetical protein